MAQGNTITRPPLSAWQTELIRLTLFPSPSINVIQQNWWEELMDEPPTKQNKNLKTFEQSDEGMFKSGRLILNVNPIRIDWIYTAQELGENQTLAKLPVFETFDHALKDFSILMKKWLSTQDLKLARMALGCVLLQEVESHVAGYRLVSSYLPFTLDGEISSDFLYRINKKRETKTNIDDLVINRLSTWGVAFLQNFAILASRGRTIQQRFDKPMYAVRLELDVNTSADLTVDLPTEKLVDIFQELNDFGSEIAEKGDIE